MVNAQGYHIIRTTVEGGVDVQRAKLVLTKRLGRFVSIGETVSIIAAEWLLDNKEES